MVPCGSQHLRNGKGWVVLNQRKRIAKQKPRGEFYPYRKPNQLGKGGPKLSASTRIDRILECYRGLVVTVSAVMSYLHHDGVFVSRETVRRKILDFGCEQIDMGAYEVPNRLGRPPKPAGTEEPADEQPTVAAAEPSAQPDKEPEPQPTT